MKVVILGGTGLISGSIVSQLVARGDDVLVYNRGRTVASLPEKVKHLVGERKDVGNLREQFAALAPDCVIDMCGYSECEAAALVEATTSLVPQVIFCSTTDVFVKGSGPYPLDESAPRGASAAFPYAVGKVASELLLERAAASGAFALTIIRPAQTYGGPNHGPNHPLGHRGYHLWRLTNGAPIILHGDASSLWSACYAPDVAQAFVAAVGNARAYNRDYITASPEVLTWLRYWEIAGEAFGAPPLDCVTIPSNVLGPMFGPDGVVLTENYRFNNVFDCTRAASELHFACTTSLLEGFAAVARDYGDAWIREGVAERDSEYARHYEATLEWWRRLRRTAPSHR
jgi:nucleoside-diphosphate-sugar epimerase